jgi:thiol-disulfide isomerase/thioredoxin
MNGLVGSVIAVAVLLACTGFGLLRGRRDGALDPVPDCADPHADDDRTTAAPHAGLLAGLGVVAGTPVTLVQFSTEFCSPCRATRALCAGIAANAEGVRHLDVAAETHLDAVRALDISRTPTLLLVDAAGRVVRRCVGLPTHANLTAAIGERTAAAS